MAPPCITCGRTSTRLCDFVLGVCPELGEEQRVITCDAPLCDRCTKQIGHTHICGRGRGHKGCHHDTVDRCPAHAELGSGFTKRISRRDAEEIFARREAISQQKGNP